MRLPQESPVDSLPLTPEQRQKLADLRSEYVALATTSGDLTLLGPRHDFRYGAWVRLSRYCDSLTTPE